MRMMRATTWIPMIRVLTIATIVRMKMRIICEIMMMMMMIVIMMMSTRTRPMMTLENRQR